MPRYTSLRSIRVQHLALGLALALVTWAFGPRIGAASGGSGSCPAILSWNNPNPGYVYLQYEWIDDGVRWGYYEGTMGWVTSTGPYDCTNQIAYITP